MSQQIRVEIRAFNNEALFEPRGGETMVMFEYFPGQGGEPGEHFHRVAGGRLRLRVNKRTHKIRFENETEDMVDVVIEEKKPTGGESQAER
jgi:hypothetical protein